MKGYTVFNAEQIDGLPARFAVGTGTFPAPGLQDFERLSSQRRAPLLAPLALATDMGPVPVTMSQGARR